MGGEHPGPPPPSDLGIEKCRHERLRFAWRVYEGLNQSRRYGYQCVDCGKCDLRFDLNSTRYKWVGKKKCYVTHGRFAYEAVPYDDEVTAAAAIRLREYYWTRREAKKSVFTEWYNKYLESGAWRELRQTILERDKYKCVLCKGDAQQVHHISYERAGYEQPEDLISICLECHQSVHGRDFPSDRMR